MAKKVALNDQLEAQIEALAKKKGVNKEDILLQAIGLMKFLDDREADSVVVRRKGNDVDEVTL